MLVRLVAAVAAIAFPQAPARSTSTTSPGARARLRRSRTRRRAATLPKELKDLVRPVPRHPLPARRVAVARREPAVRAPVLSSGLVLRQARAHLRDRAGVRARVPLRSRELFDYGKNKFDKAALRDLGFAGFRVHFALNTPKYKDEVLVFLGASYFRALGKDQRYGLRRAGSPSTPALGSGEEFPRSPSSGSSARRRARRSSRSTRCSTRARVTGAYRFVVRPGAETVTTCRRASSCASSVDQARHRAADQHVPLRREPAAPAHATTAPRCTTPTAC